MTAALLIAVVALASRGGPGASSGADIPAVASRLSFASGDHVVGAVDDNANADRPSHTALALSPDGRRLVFVGERGGVRQLFVRALNTETAVPITGTEGAESPFFSPNGTSVGYWSAERLMRVEFDGGLPAQIATMPRISGASWSDDGRIVVGIRTVGLVIVPVSGGAPPDTIKGPLSLPYFLPEASRRV